MRMAQGTILAVVIGLTLVVGSARVEATSYRIELTNGREITTTRVWEEGDKVKFDLHEGIGGVPKALVTRITPVNLPGQHQPLTSPRPPRPADAEGSRPDPRPGAAQVPVSRSTPPPDQGRQAAAY